MEQDALNAQAAFLLPKHAWKRHILNWQGYGILLRMVGLRPKMSKRDLLNALGGNVQKAMNGKQFQLT